MLSDSTTTSFRRNTSRSRQATQHTIVLSYDAGMNRDGSNLLGMQVQGVGYPTANQHSYGASSRNFDWCTTPKNIQCAFLKA
jgi:hypothetical protein